MEIKRHPEFTKWLNGLANVPNRNRIAAAIAKLAFGIGTTKRLTDSKLHELVIDFGPGFRIYFLKRGQELIILLGGGPKRTQARDIKKAEDRSKEV